MPTMDLSLELFLDKEAGSEIIVSVDFKVTSAGCSAHMGGMNYPGHPAEPPEIEIGKIFWPVRTGRFVDDHIEFPAKGFPVAVLEAMEAYICDHYDPAEHDRSDGA